MARISQRFGLGRSQATLDFVDVNLNTDTKLFISPRALELYPSAWGHECVALIQDFFEHILSLIRDGKHGRAEALLGALNEPNETRLGLSRGKPQGRGLGASQAHAVWEALSKSEAAKQGLLEDLEDTVLMISGISADLISDMTTNIIRMPLIHYTQDMCAYYGIPLTPGVNSGPFWDPSRSTWMQDSVPLPMADGDKIVLVPKAIVRREPLYNPTEYYRHFVLERLRQVELDANSSLVELLKNKKRRVTKKRLYEKYGDGKDAIVRETIKRPDILEQYKATKSKRPYFALSHEDLAAVEKAKDPDWDALLHRVRKVKPGNKEAPEYENAVEALLSALFYPQLSHPQKQTPIHDGRKRVDITYSNSSRGGFFHWLALHYAAPFVFVECKNYGKELGNPELDQITGRFSPSRGEFGIIVCRSFANRNLFAQRCRDTANDERGFVVALDDDDLGALVHLRKHQPQEFPHMLPLRQQFDKLVL